MKTLLVNGFRVLLAAIIIFLCYGWWVSDQARYYQTELGPELRERYGFATGTPVIRAGDQSVEVFAVYPELGSVMETSGIRQGDIILSMSLTEFYHRLSKLDGEMSLHVVEGGDGLPVDERPSRMISLKSLLLD